MRSFWTWAIPRLVELPPSSWDSAIRSAHRIDFDMVERIGIIAGVAFVAYLLRVRPEQAASLTLPMIYLVQFVEAVPLLFLIVGPVFLRRARRGIDLVIEGHRERAVQRPDLQSGNK